MPGESWRLTIAAARYAELASDERFVHLLALARCVNSLRFGQSALNAVRNSDSPDGMRTRFNSFLYTSAVLFEALNVARWLASHFRSRPAFEDMRRILADRGVSSLASKKLKPLRNWFVFHFDPDQYRAALALRFEEDAPEFVIGTDSQAYYALADMVVIRSLIPSPKSDEERDALYADLLGSVAHLAVRFVTAADRLIVAVLHDMGWRIDPPGSSL